MASATSKSNMTKKTNAKAPVDSKSNNTGKHAKETASSANSGDQKWPSGPHPHLYSPEWKEYFRKIITDRREDIMRDLGYLKESSLEMTTDSYSGDSSTYSFHMADQGTDAQEREKAFMFASRDGKMLMLLDL